MNAFESIVGREAYPVLSLYRLAQGSVTLTKTLLWTKISAPSLESIPVFMFSKYEL
jgi:hypothetical protein